MSHYEDQREAWENAERKATAERRRKRMEVQRKAKIAALRKLTENK